MWLLIGVVAADRCCGPVVSCTFGDRRLNKQEKCPKCKCNKDRFTFLHSGSYGWACHCEIGDEICDYMRYRQDAEQP